MSSHQEELVKAKRFLSKQDPVLSNLIRLCGDCDISPKRQHFKILLNSIVGQQLSVKAAATIRQRVYDLVDNQPDPQSVLLISHEKLRAAGLSNQKAIYVHELSNAFSDANHGLNKLHLCNNDEVFLKLIRIKGIGEWSVHMFLMFGLGRLDVLPHGDLGIQNAAKRFYQLRMPIHKKKLDRLAAKWKPYRSVASWYLWRGLDLK